MYLSSWNRTAGVELTRIDKKKMPTCIPKNVLAEIEREYGSCEFSRTAHRECNIWINEHYPRIQRDKIYENGVKWGRNHSDVVKRFGFDQMCVEVASQKLKNWASLEKFFRLCDDYLEKTGMYVRYHEDCGGTGGHIHVNIHSSEEAGHFQRVMMLHPEAMFAFAHPSDSQHGLLHRNAISRDNIHRGIIGKSGPLAYRPEYGSVEFRLFDVAQTWEMQEEHMAFAQSFIRYAQKTVLPEKLPTRENIENTTVEKHTKNFEKLIKKLGLPWKRYDFYVHNIVTRFEQRTENFFHVEHY